MKISSILILVFSHTPWKFRFFVSHPHGIPCYYVLTLWKFHYPQSKNPLEFPNCEIQYLLNFHYPQRGRIQNFSGKAHWSRLHTWEGQYPAMPGYKRVSSNLKIHLEVLDTSCPFALFVQTFDQYWSLNDSVRRPYQLFLQSKSWIQVNFKLFVRTRLCNNILKCKKNFLFWDFWRM